MPKDRSESYSDEIEAARLAMRSSPGLLTDDERTALRAAAVLVKADGTASDTLRALARHKWIDEAGEAGTEALELGGDGLLRRIGQRLLRREDVDFNRCPQCGRIPRTREARWCPWCDFTSSGERLSPVPSSKKESP